MDTKASRSRETSHESKEHAQDCHMLTSYVLFAEQWAILLCKGTNLEPSAKVIKKGKGLAAFSPCFSLQAIAEAAGAGYFGGDLHYHFCLAIPMFRYKCGPLHMPKYPHCHTSTRRPDHQFAVGRPGRRRRQCRANKPIKISLITPLDADPRHISMPLARVQRGVSDMCVAPPGFGSKRRSVSPAEPSPSRAAGLLGGAKRRVEG